MNHWPGWSFTDRYLVSVPLVTGANQRERLYGWDYLERTGATHFLLTAS